MRLFRSILVPLDGSPFAEQALPLALQIAQRSSSAVRLVRVHQILTQGALLAEVPAYYAGFDAELRKVEEAYLEKCRAAASADTGLAIQAAVLDGPVGPSLAEYVAGGAADLVVMATHGRGGLSRLWLGGVADYMMRHTEVPMLLCRPREGAAAPTVLPRSILIPLDRSELSRSILEPATALGHLGGAEYTVFTVVEPLMVLGDPLSGAPPPSDPQLTERMRIDAERYVGDTAQQLAGKGHRVRSSTVVSAGVASAILAEAAVGKYDLIALATHGAGGVRRALLGSVTDKVVRGSTGPVLVLRPGKGHG